MTFAPERIPSVRPVGESVLSAVVAGMSACGKIILRKLILLAVKSEAALVDSVGIASDGCAEVCGIVLREIVTDIVESEDYILELTVLVRNHDGDDTSSEIGNTYFHSVLIGQGIERCRSSVILIDEILRIKSGLGQFRLCWL